MVKYGKMVLGLVINIVFGIIGPVVWLFMQDSVRMAKDDKSAATAVFFAAFVPALVLFAVWYKNTLNFQVSASKHKPNMWLFYGIGVVAAAAIAITGGLIFYKAIIYAIVVLACVIVGSLVSYFVGQPK